LLDSEFGVLLEQAKSNKESANELARAERMLGMNGYLKAQG
jgi:hypothetical protein